ncbi:hypothetical protein SLINC_8065 [Streptomyces lincolnensis]|uniref:Mycothiol-dependent maleylpyruvate isomerase metal-binding domain-containing protein n=1 Tax=Streptomyces lincolnensis TaxID=1915 RepID=A0A1B1MNV2_STRLN|nr:hypothetical protein [Streptomyces lincolnensis]ANS70289.1 hypothetical protein SLINC_8065 [Streptomyces lincolnensis]
MDTTALRGAYDKLLDAAATPGLGEAADGGWDADHVLAHLLSLDASVAAVALGVVAGARPTLDNRISLDPWNLDRVIARHTDRADLIEHVRRQAGVLCDIADQLDEQAAAVLVPTLLLSNDTVAVDQPLPLAALIDGLAGNHVPEHTRQLLDLRVA